MILQVSNFFVTYRQTHEIRSVCYQDQECMLLWSGVYATWAICRGVFTPKKYNTVSRRPILETRQIFLFTHNLQCLKLYKFHLLIYILYSMTLSFTLLSFPLLYIYPTVENVIGLLQWPIDSKSNIVLKNNVSSIR